MRKLITLTTALVLCQNVFAFSEKEIFVRSGAMDKDIPVTVITPDGYEEGRSYPVVYILHGYSDDHRIWVKKGVVGDLVDQYDVLAVMPDGGFSSWYWDSPMMPEFRYETFVINELIPYIDSTYSTMAERAGRAVTGHSMGGHGALYLSFRHQDVFGSAGAMSGGVDIRPFPQKWDMAQRLGSIEEYPQNWDDHTVINLTHLLSPDSLNIVFDCGTEDFFYEVNCNFHQKLLDLKIPHEFHSRPGGHTWTYWKNAIKYHFLFFSDRFKKQ